MTYRGNVDLKKLRAIRENKVVRFFAKPVAFVQDKIRIRKYLKSEDSRFVRNLKDSHKGERCFIIGNGPSLRTEDLDVLAANNVVCFGSNRVFKIYPRTAWRPSYYLSLDRIVAMEVIDDIVAFGTFPKFLNYKDAKLFGRPDDSIHYLCPSDFFAVDINKNISPSLSEDLSRSFSKVGTVTVAAVELAIYMGFTSIYLLGVDNNYAHKRMADGTIYVDQTVKTSYFAGGEPDKASGVSVQPVYRTEQSYRLAKDFAERHTVKIFNATRGGKLEVFERVDFDELMGRKE